MTTIRELVARHADESKLAMTCLRMQKQPDSKIELDEMTVADLRMAFAYAAVTLPVDFVAIAFERR